MLVALWLAAAQTGGAPVALPDPVAIAVPDLAADSRPLGDEKKFFVFHRLGATFAEAVDDLSFCMRFAAQPMFDPAPTFAPWIEQDTTPHREMVNNYGLVGALMAGPIIAGVGRSLRAVNMTSCMRPRGYARYVVSEPMWHELNGKDVRASVLMQAKIASGPTPKTPRSLP